MTNLKRAKAMTTAIPATTVPALTSKTISCLNIAGAAIN